MSYLVANPEDRFSRDEAYFIHIETSPTESEREKHGKSEVNDRNSHLFLTPK